MTIVATNNITVSNVNDGTITHTAYANSADGTDKFTTVYPNLNLLDGTKDFSGTWTFSGGWTNDGIYKGLTVKKRTAQWSGIYKTFTATKDGAYTFSAYIKSSGNTANIFRFVFLNGVGVNDKLIGNNFDWFRDSVTLNLKANDTIFIRYEISGTGTDSILWNTGHKWEFGSIATSWMPSASEVKTADYPSYIGQYRDFTQADSTNPSVYTWSLIRGSDGSDGADGISPTVTVNPDTSLTIVDAQGTSTTPALKGADGTDGTSGIIVSSVAPSSPQTGQLWQDTSTTPQLVKKWTGNEWVIWELYVENMNVNNLSALSPNLGNITGGSYTSWSIEDYDVYDYLSGIYLFKGGIRFFTIENPNTIDPDTSGVASGKMIRGMSIISGVVQFYQQQIPLEDTRTANAILKEVDGFWTPYSDVGGYCGSISSYKYSGGIGQLTLNADLISVIGDLRNNNNIKGWTTISTGYGTNARTDPNNPLQYKVESNINGTRKVMFRGNIASISGNLIQSVVLTLPVDARPSSNGISFPCMGNSARLARIVIDSNGAVGYNVAYGSTDMQSVSLSPIWYDVE